MGKPSKIIAAAEHSDGWYRLAYKAVSGYVNFRPTGKPISKHFRSLIRWHYDQLRIITASGARPVHVYRTKDRKKLDLAQAAAGMQVPNRFRVAFFSKAAGGKTRIIVRGGKVRVISKIEGEDDDAVERDFIPFSDFEDYDGELEQDPEAVIKRTVDNAPEFEVYAIQCGEHESSITYSDAENARLELNRYFEEYENILDWCRGVIGYSFTNQKTFSEYQAARRAVKKNKQRRVRARKKKA